MTPRPGRLHPLVVLVALALIPTILLWAVWQWADTRAAIAEEGVPPTVTSVPPPAGFPALATPLLSYRRTAGRLSRDLNLEAFESAVEPLLAAVDDRSCTAVSLDGRVVGERNADLAVIPASNQKILVAAVAIEVLGPDFTYETKVVAPAPEAGVIDGDVYLVGGGDPLLSGDWYPESGLDRFPAFNITSLDALADDVAAAGVTQINGAVRGDGSRYDDEFYAPGWGAVVAGLEAGPYDALLVNDARVRNDDQRATDPNEGGAREFVRLLGERGITVSGGSGVGVAPVDLPGLAAVRSQPLPAVVEEMLTNSDNNTAELVVKEIGLAATGAGSRIAGLEVMADTITGWGVDAAGLVLADGSGLSLDNRLTCRALLGVLQHAGSSGPVADGLAVAGETGTLVDVFGDTAVAGRLRAKTGTLNNFPIDQDPPAVKALAGFLPVEGGGAIEFALLLNGPTISDQSEYRPIWNELVAALSSFPAVASPAALGPR
ncbi:MAG: D-alanyl-D-alanine carboxypeptidase/D-alanyl-D-alanine-endopeptidase [Ilumatobacter sp.]|nr:D-alanyl-D-alanine carboxypeptidase/D-alanyl-D-alanine-endopeptidase [Ilumatobacter sp.]